jgi:hypothetical protein
MICVSWAISNSAERGRGEENGDVEQENKPPCHKLFASPTFSGRGKCAHNSHAQMSFKRLILQI